MKCKCS